MDIYFHYLLCKKFFISSLSGTLPYFINLSSFQYYIKNRDPKPVLNDIYKDKDSYENTEIGIKRMLIYAK
jgi:hypothetical protein